MGDHGGKLCAQPPFQRTLFLVLAKHQNVVGRSWRQDSMVCMQDAELDEKVFSCAFLGLLLVRGWCSQALGEFRGMFSWSLGQHR